MSAPVGGGGAPHAAARGRLGPTLAALATAAALSAGSPGPAAAAPLPPEAARALAELDREPSVAALQRAAARRLRAIAPAARRARAAALLPELTLGLERRLGRDDALDPGADPTAAELEARTRDATVLEARALFRLDRLAFDPIEARLAELDVRLERLRDDLAARVTRLYFERRRLQVERRLAPPTDPIEATRIELRVQELGAALDALCGSALSGSTR